MSRYERLARLMSIMNTVRIHRKPNRKSLAEQFGVTVRTIQRDINTLCYAGVPIFWNDDRYQIMPGFFIPQMHLTLEEVFNLVCATEAYSKGEEGPEQTAIKSAMSKIIAALSNETRNSLEAILAEQNLSSSILGPTQREEGTSTLHIAYCTPLATKRIYPPGSPG